MSLSSYDKTAGDWRSQLRRNERNTRWVIGLFLVVYAGGGLLADVFILQSQYPHVRLLVCIHALLTLQVMPWATIVMIVIAGVSLLITYAMYDRIMLLGTDSREITRESASSREELQLFNVVEEMKIAAGLQFMPKVFLIEADYMNAFASGYSEKSAMVAITRGLMEKLDRAELQAVMAHELSHIRHHDIKLTLMVAILSNILLIVIDMLFYAVIFKRDSRDNNPLLMGIIILRYVLPLLTLVLTLFLSRTREFMADSGAVELMRDNEPMARALLKINQDHEEHAQHYAQEYGQTAHEEVRRASYLFDPSSIDPVKSLSSAFSTHPSITKRLDALGFKRKR